MRRPEYSIVLDVHVHFVICGDGELRERAFAVQVSSVSSGVISPPRWILMLHSIKNSGRRGRTYAPKLTSLIVERPTAPLMLRRRTL